MKGCKESAIIQSTQNGFVDEIEYHIKGNEPVMVKNKAAMIACKQQNLESLKQIVSHGVSCLFKLLITSVQLNNLEIVQYMCTFYIEDPEFLALRTAIDNDNKDIVKCLIQKETETDTNVLRCCFDLEFYKVVEYIIPFYPLETQAIWQEELDLISTKNKYKPDTYSKIDFLGERVCNYYDEYYFITEDMTLTVDQIYMQVCQNPPANLNKYDPDILECVKEAAISNYWLLTTPPDSKVQILVVHSTG